MRSTERFAGRAAIVTGAGGGTGLAIAEALHREGCRVLGVDLKSRPETLPEECLYLEADITETAAIKQVFGDHAWQLAVSGTKGYYGHALGASGAIEVAICALAMRRRWLPPTVNLQHPDPGCDLDCLPGDGRAAEPDAVLSNRLVMQAYLGTDPGADDAAA